MDPGPIPTFSPLIGYFINSAAPSAVAILPANIWTLSLKSFFNSFIVFITLEECA